MSNTRFLHQRLEASPFWRQVGWQLDSRQSGDVRLRLPYSEANTTAATALHGGVIAATLDVAGSLAAWSAGGNSNDAFVGRTLSCDVSYIAGALGEDIFGEATVLRRGKEIIYSSVQAKSREGKVLASGNHIFHIALPGTVPPPPDAVVANYVPQGNSDQGLGHLPSRQPDIVAANLRMLERMDGRMPYMDQLCWRFMRGDFGFAEHLLPARGIALGEDRGIAGGALLSAVDHAGSLAAWMTTRLGDRKLFGSTVNTKLQTIATPIDRDVRVQARALGGTGDLIGSVVSIITEAGEAVASGSTMYRIIERTGD
ncbi:MAG: hotdog domain-containing protein [bacterium]